MFDGGCVNLLKTVFIFVLGLASFSASSAAPISCDNSQVASAGIVHAEEPNICVYQDPTVTLADGTKAALRAYPFANADVNIEGFCNLQGQAGIVEHYYVGCEEDFCDSAAIDLNKDGSVLQIYPNRVGSYPNGAILQIYCSVSAR